MRLRTGIKNLVANILEEIFPSECLMCQHEGAWLCDSCQKTTIAIQSPTCPFCDKLSALGKTCARCKNHSTLFGARSIWYYKPPIPTLVHHFKYGGIKASVDFLRSELGRLYRELPLSPRANVLITSVPSSRERLQKYGFNQSEILAKALASAVSVPYRPLLGRHKQSQSQTKLGRQARLTNAIGQFYPRQVIDLTGTTVILVDDVLTTGATLSASALELKKLGAKQVWGLTIAKD